MESFGVWVWTTAVPRKSTGLKSLQYMEKHPGQTVSFFKQYFHFLLLTSKLSQFPDSFSSFYWDSPDWQDNALPSATRCMKDLSARSSRLAPAPPARPWPPPAPAVSVRLGFRTAGKNWTICTFFRCPLQRRTTPVHPRGAFNEGEGTRRPCSLVKSRGRGEILPPLMIFFLKFFNKHKQRGGDPLDIFYGPSLQIELDAPLVHPDLRRSKIEPETACAARRNTTTE